MPPPDPDSIHCPGCRPESRFHSRIFNRSNGAVSFYDLNGKPILREEEGGRKFEPINVQGTDGFTVTQSFQSLDDDEGLYGLGQHQSNEFNYLYSLPHLCYNASRLVSTPSPSAGFPRSFGYTGLAARYGPFSKQKMEVFLQ